MKCRFLVTAGLVAMTMGWSLPISSVALEIDDPKASDSVESVKTTKAKLRELVNEKKWDEAWQMLDQFASEYRDESIVQSLNIELAIRALFVQPKQAEERLKKAVDYLCNKGELSKQDAAELGSAVSSLNMLLSRTRNFELAATIAKKSVDATLKMPSTHLPTLRSLELQLSRALYYDGKVDEGWSILEKTYDSSMKDIVAGEVKGGEFVSQFLSVTSLYRSQMKDKIESLLSAAEAFFASRLDGEQGTVDDLRALSSFLTSKISANVYTDPALGKTYFDQLTASIERFEATHDSASNQIQPIKASLKALEVRLGQSLARLELIGTEAPEFDPQDFVGMEPASLADLRGKVVLMDFWAIWCGPCIATFPHLRDWHEKFGPKGFVILGMTKNYSYKWDEKNSRPVKAEEVSNEEELEMLHAFRDHHQLKHGFVLTNANSDYSKKLMVSGIPQVVLLDKQGKIRMIKIGSQESNAIDLEAEIEKLLSN